MIYIQLQATVIKGTMALVLLADMGFPRREQMLALVRLFDLTQIACLNDPNYPDGNFCTISGGIPTAWLSCRDGYVDQSTNTCVSKCPSGQYGSAENFHTSEGTVQLSICKACTGGCLECVGPSMCTSCPRTKYLTRNSPANTQPFWGTCGSTKTGTNHAITLYVTTPPSNNNV